MKYIFSISLVIFFIPFITYGVTVVDDVQVDTTWTVQDSPYLLNEPFIVYPGVTLTIDPGVVIKLRQGGIFIVRGGRVFAQGTKTNPIYITSDRDDSFGGDTNQDGLSTSPAIGDWIGIDIEDGSYVRLENTFVSYTGGVFLFPTVRNNGYLELSSTTLSNGIIALENKTGTSSIHYSNFFNHEQGVIAYDGSVFIEYSNIETINTGVSNPSQKNITAINNWWKDSSGPSHPQLNPTGLGVGVDDNVSFIPWLNRPHGTSSPQSLCCSSVLFLPGFMGSDLYVQEGISENQLWPPTSLLKTDIAKLELDSQGNPVTSGIYTKSIIEETFGVDIYRNFADHMRSLVQEQDIKEWLPFPYDWRRDLDQVINNFTTLKVGNDFQNKRLIDEAAALAQRSPTGKITIIGHSNGGLVGKALIRELANQGQESLIDQFIMVATPQLGTPKAIAGLLHGDEQEIPEGFGFLVGKEEARGLGANLQSAFNLFPIDLYFQNNSSSVINFDTSLVNVFDHSLYNLPDTISSYSDLISFATISQRGNINGNPTDVPSILRADLLDNANVSIGDLALWVVPSSIKQYQLVGVGQQTVANIEYQSREEFNCYAQIASYLCRKEYFWDRILNSSFDGDGTVLSSSATFVNGNASEIYFLDIFNTNKDLLINRKHNDILENSNVLGLLENLLLSKEVNSSPLYITKTKPNLPNSFQQISVHSPILLSVSDHKGNFVGRDITKQGGDFVFLREEIPNSGYYEINDQKYITVSMGDSYRVDLQGGGFGTFTLNVDQYQNGVLSRESFIDIPVTPSLRGYLDLRGDNVVGALNLDVQGDGTFDTVISPEDEFNPAIYIENIKIIVKDFDLKGTQEFKALQELNSIKELINISKYEKAEQRLKKYLKHLGELLIRDKEKDGFDTNEIQLLIEYLEQLKANI